MWKLIKSEFSYFRIFYSVIFFIVFVYTLILLFTNIARGALHDIFGFLLPFSFIYAFVHPVFIRYREKRDSLHYLIPVSTLKTAVSRIVVLVLHWILIRLYFVALIYFSQMDPYLIPVLPAGLILAAIVLFIVILDVSFILPFYIKIWRLGVVIITAFIILIGGIIALNFVRIYVIGNIFYGDIYEQVYYYWALGSVITIFLSIISVFTFKKRKFYQA